MSHVSVLQEEVVAHLRVPPLPRNSWLVDGTLGAGGHAEALLLSHPHVRLLGLDRDAEALAVAGERLKGFGGRVVLAQSNFAGMAEAVHAHGVGPVVGVLLDIGVSSMQLDRAERGFSFMRDGPLDMRMDASPGVPTAAELIRSLPEKDLADVIFRYGEERNARRIARHIKEALARGGTLDRTGALAELVAGAAGGRAGRIHPATRTFQALRMTVNGELEALDAGLSAAFDLLAPGGRLAVISFHSLEDRLVKQFMTLHEGRMTALAGGGVRWSGALPKGRRITKKPVTPGEEELAANPRARSAKLRVLERVAEDE